MKPSYKLCALCALLLGTLFLFAGCEKENDTNTDPLQTENPQNPQSNIDLSNTSWSCRYENDYNYMGVVMHLDYESFLDFFDDTTGEQYDAVTMTIPAMPAFGTQVEEQTLPFTCSYQGNTVTIHQEIEYQGTLYSNDYQAVYDPDAKTLTVNSNDPDMVAMLGTDIMVYHRIY